MSGFFSKRQTVIATAVIAVAAVLAAGWFLLISPERQKVASIRKAADDQQSTNAGMQNQIAMLRAIQRELPERQAALQRLQAKAPADPAIPDLLRTLNDAAGKSGVQLVGVAPTQPSDVAGAPGVRAIDLTLTVRGGYVELEQYEVALEGLSRAFLVKGMSISSGSASSSSGASSSPASGGTANGAAPLSATINGRVLMNTSAAAVASTPTASGQKTTGD